MKSVFWYIFEGKKGILCLCKCGNQFVEVLPAKKSDVTVVLEPVTRLQGADEQPLMLMAKASYTEPVTK